MKKLIIFFVFIVSASYGQTSDALKLCVAIQNNFTTNTEANNAVDKILSVIGTSQKPILQPCSNINNAVAASYKGQRYILYDKDFMESLTVGRNKYWSNMFILAHEVGHHINGHSLDIILYQNDVINPKSLSTRRSQELEADEFAGFVLAKLGATFNQTSKVLLNIPKISNDYDSTHPSTDKRIRAVKNGWEKGFNKVNVISNSKINRPKKDYNTGKSNLSSSWEYVKFNPFQKEKEWYERQGSDYKYKVNFEDPFVLNRYKYFPRVARKSSSIGKSTTGNDFCKLIITQRKIPNGKDPSDFPRMESYPRETFPLQSIEIKIDYVYDLPKFSSDEFWFKNNGYEVVDTHDRKNGNLFEENYFEVQFLIDDIYEGSLWFKFEGYTSTASSLYFLGSDEEAKRDYKKEKREVLNKFKSQKKTDRYFKRYKNKINVDELIYPSSLFMSSESLNGMEEEDEEELKSLKNFIDAIKKGRKLYLKIGKQKRDGYIWDDNNNLEIIKLNKRSFESQTYEFDLTGSARALNIE